MAIRSLVLVNGRTGKVLAREKKKKKKMVFQKELRIYRMYTLINEKCKGKKRITKRPFCQPLIYMLGIESLFPLSSPFPIW